MWHVVCGMSYLTLLCSIFSLLIPLSHSEYLYSGRWIQWAWTNGDSSIKYMFADDEHTVNSFSSDATSITFHNSGNMDYTVTITKNESCFPSSDAFNIDFVLECDGTPGSGNGGWAGIYYKNSTTDWSHLSTDFWVQIETETGTPEPTPYQTPAPQTVFLSSNTWTEWAYTNGNETGVEYNFRYGVNQLYSFNTNATQIIFKQQPDSYHYELDADHMCWPHQNFNIDDLLLCISINQSVPPGTGMTGWAGIYYKAGVSGTNTDWSHQEAQFAVYITLVTHHPTQWPTREPTTEWPTTWPTPEPTAFPTPEPTEWPTPEPTEWPTHEPTAFPTPEPTEWPTSEPTEWPTPEPSTAPTNDPSANPTSDPTLEPTFDPTFDPTLVPSRSPVECPYNSFRYNSDNTTNKCLKCDANDKGYECKCGSYLNVEYGYWLSLYAINDNHSIISLQCPMGQCCLNPQGCDYFNSSDSQLLCAKNRNVSSITCSRCNDGYYELFGSFACGHCKQTNYVMITVLFISALVFALFLLFIMSRPRPNALRMNTKGTEIDWRKLLFYDHKNLLIVLIFKICMYYYQGLNQILSSKNITTSSQFQRTLLMLFSFDLSLFDPLFWSVQTDGTCFIAGIDSGIYKMIFSYTWYAFVALNVLIIVLLSRVRCICKCIPCACVPYIKAGCINTILMTAGPL
eukprot:28742_1